MGSAFASRLLNGGCPVIGYDIDAECGAALARQGGKSVKTVGEVVHQCARVILSLPSHREVAQVISAADGALRAGHIIIDTTTGDPEHSETLAVELAARGVTYLDATISGNSALIQVLRGRTAKGARG